MRVLASYNLKGGVGKTTTVVNLAYLAAAGGARTIVWDLDPQGAATYFFRTKAKVRGRGRSLVRGRSEIGDVIKSTDHRRLDVLPADFSYRNLDLVLDRTKKPTRRLANLVRPLAADYDYCFLDCPPSISLVSENVFFAADALLMPMIPTTLSLRSLEQLGTFMAGGPWRKLAVMPFFSQVDRRKGMHRQLVEALPRERASMLTSYIPSSVDVERMGQHRAPVPVFAPTSASALAYAMLWGEVKGRLTQAPVGVGAQLRADGRAASRRLAAVALPHA